MRRSVIMFWLFAVGTLLVDQISKAIVRVQMVPGESVALIDGVFHLTYVRNAGAAFGLFPGQQSVFMLTTGIVLFVIGAYWRRARPDAWPIVTALGLISGGSVGNLIDRAFLGRVTDFFDATLIDFPVFNIADCGIVIGVGILIVWLLVVPEPETASSDPAPAEHRSDGETA